MKELWDYCLLRRLLLTAEYLPGIQNTQADALSRAKPDASDWQLASEIFLQVNKIWGPFTVDLFASRSNTQLKRYVSWKLDPEAIAVDALQMSWNREKGYAFPPFCMIGRCLAKVQAEKADLILIAPVWPAQPWFAVLLHLLQDNPILLPQWPGLLSSPLGSPHPLIQSNSLCLAVWNITGNISSHKGFLRTQPTSSLNHGGEALGQLTAVPGRSGLAGVVDGHLIQYRPLWQL